VSRHAAARIDGSVHHLQIRLANLVDASCSMSGPSAPLELPWL
jgi:hypothetical protein